MNIEQRIEIAKKYIDAFGRTYKTPVQILEECEKLKILGCEWGDITFGDYGRIGEDFIMRKGGDIVNQTTKYEFDKDSYYIHWDNGNVGRLMFLGNADYSDEETKIWLEFKAELLSYNPLDYDKHNCHIVYGIEDGMRLKKDYKDICDKTKEKFSMLLKKRRLEKAKETYEKLLAEQLGE